jgi:mannosyl-oligosaccharide alpha-1,2-mannosidase
LKSHDHLASSYLDFTMFRFRRYRVFLILAAVTVFLLYRFSQPSQWEEATASAAAIKDRIGLGSHKPPKLAVPDADKEKKVHSLPEKADRETPNPPKIPVKQPDKVPPPPAEDIPKPVQNVPPPKTGQQKVGDGGLHNTGGLIVTPDRPSKTEEGPDGGIWSSPKEDPEVVLVPGGHGRVPIDQLPTNGPRERWTKLPEHYPVPTESIIPLPTGKGKSIPKIQHKFGKESAETKTVRLQRLDTVKEAFLHAWDGYKALAWGKDELRPVSGKSRNTFNGWSATLVDALDTMWVMGLTKEFEEGVEFVKSIDFYASTRTEIPVFETTIRYLGGLLGAYDVSEGKYPVLLERARDLGDMLMAAFDTPNRMPLTYYPWKLAFASQPHRSSRAVLAEIGSLQMEFTRLAQLTGNSSYYDAITRVVDALEAFQENTTMPGIWPADIDTSGCAKIPGTYRAPSRNMLNSFTYPDKKTEKKSETPPMEPLIKPPPVQFEAKESDPEHPLPEPIVVPNKAETFAPFKNPDVKDLGPLTPLKKPDPVVFKPKGDPKIVKRQISDPNVNTPEVDIPEVNTVPEPGILFLNRGSGQTQAYKAPEEPPCIETGLTASGGLEKYTLGSTSDSAFEYLTKQYLLLSGQVEKYRKMYERAMDVANENLIIRVMIPDEERELYVAGEVRISTYGHKIDRSFHSEESHLVCFVGGMFAMGAKVFNRPKDLELAAKLTDGCVWAYESTASGIMPETFEVVACDSRTDCHWNETKWYEEIDPNAEMRLEMYEEQMKSYNFQVAQLASEAAAEAALATPTPRIADSEKATLSSPARAVVTQAQDSAREPPAGFDPLHNPEAERIPKYEHQKRQADPLELADDSTPDWPAPKAARPAPFEHRKAPPTHELADDSTPDWPAPKRKPGIIEEAPLSRPLAHDSTPDWPAPERRPAPVAHPGKTRPGTMKEAPPSRPIAHNSISDWSAPVLPDEKADDVTETPTRVVKDNDESIFRPPTFVENVPPPIWSPTKPQTREEYAKMMIKQHRLKPGMKTMRDPRYLLR